MRHGATLELNGNPKEIPLLGPLEFRCPSGKTQIVAMSPGYCPIERTETLKAGQKQVLRFQWRELSASRKSDSTERAGTGKGRPGVSGEEEPAETVTTETPPAQEESRFGVAAKKAGPASPATRKPPAGGEPAVEAKVKAAIPSETAQAEIAKQLDETYHFDQVATTANKLRLAAELRSQAGKTVEPDKRFVLVRQGGRAGKRSRRCRRHDPRRGCDGRQL